jgi:hypothetical protein
MNKIFAGIVGLMLVVGVTSGTAYALFSSKATASGVTFATGNADLRIWDGDSFEADRPSAFTFTGLYPGYTGTQLLQLKNMSTSPIALTIKGILLNGPTGDWDGLKNDVWVNIRLPGVAETGYRTLAAWNSTGFTLPGGSLAQNTQRDFQFDVQVNPAATNTIAGMTLSDVTFEFTGTQVTP